MAPPEFTVKVVERCHVRPPRASAPPPISLPLTFFDIPWLLFSPSQPLFFYDLSAHLPPSAVVPILKHSLALTLQLYHPLAGNLCLPPKPGKPTIVYSDGDSVSMVIAETDGDAFHQLSGHHPRDAGLFHQLVPELALSVSRDAHVVPPLAVQITVFRNAGVSVGLAYHHVGGDWRTLNNFMKTWAAVCRRGGEMSGLATAVPFYDRSVIEDPNGLESILLKQWRQQKSQRKRVDPGLDDMVRSTFVVSPTEMERIKTWIISKCKHTNRSISLFLSPYVVTCAFIWVCLSKARLGKGSNVIKNNWEDPNYFGFIAGALTRLDYPIPATYFGNCVAFGLAAAARGELLGANGIVAAAEAICGTIKKLNEEVLGGAEEWISDWEALLGSEFHMTVSGSPKVDVYEMDYGWGRPKKIEEVSIDGLRAVSLSESRDVEGGIELGVVLHRSDMDAFASIFAEGLRVSATGACMKLDFWAA